MQLDIPGRKTFHIKNIVLDYNGTIAIDGKVIDGVCENINRLSKDFNFYVITADTFGTVKNELKNTNCEVITIPKESQDRSKMDFINSLGKDETLSVGNGRNDKLMLKQSIIGIAILQDEGLCTDSLLSSDILIKSIFDLFSFLDDPNKLVATLRN